MFPQFKLDHNNDMMWTFSYSALLTVPFANVTRVTVPSPLLSAPAAEAMVLTAVELVAADAVELGYPTCCTTMDTCAPHLLMPPHTPQESTSAGGWQHSPDGGRALLQHVPAMSTATPVPPHTPHASTPRG